MTDKIIGMIFNFDAPFAMSGKKFDQAIVSQPHYINLHILRIACEQSSLVNKDTQSTSMIFLGSISNAWL